MKCVYLEKTGNGNNVRCVLHSHTNIFFFFYFDWTSAKFVEFYFHYLILLFSQAFWISNDAVDDDNIIIIPHDDYMARVQWRYVKILASNKRTRGSTILKMPFDYRNLIVKSSPVGIWYLNTGQTYNIILFYFYYGNNCQAYTRMRMKINR